MRRFQRKNTTGFTLPELMMVVAIISLIASILTPKFARLQSRAREASAKGNLSALRSALNIYYASTEGLYPTLGFAADALTTGGKFMDEIPELKFPTDLNHVTTPHFYAGTFTAGYPPVPLGDSDSGQWVFNGVKIWINCAHVTERGNTWSVW